LTGEEDKTRKIGYQYLYTTIEQKPQEWLEGYRILTTKSQNRANFIEIGQEKNALILFL